MAAERREAVRPAGAPMMPTRARAPGAEEEGGVAEEARQVTSEVAAKAKEAGADLAGDVRARAEGELQRRSAQGAESIAAAADDVRRIADMLRERDRPGAARLAEDAARRIDGAGAYLREADMERMASDARRILRSNPTAIAVGAVVIGFAAGRLIKAAQTDGQSGSRR